MPSRRSVPGVLPDSADSEAMSRMSSESWKATPICSPNARSASIDRRVDAGEHGRRTRPAVAISEPVLSASTAQVVLDRVGALGRARRSRGSGPMTSRSNVRACSRTASGPRSASRFDARENRKSPVRIATVLSQRALADARAAPHGRLVHDVVVVQRGEVGQLDDHRGRHDSGRARVAEVRGEHADQRPEPLAAGVDQVARGVGDELVVGAHRRRAAPPRPRPARPGPTPRAPGRRSRAQPTGRIGLHPVTRAVWRRSSARSSTAAGRRRARW